MQKKVILLLSLCIFISCEEGLVDEVCQNEDQQHLVQLESDQTIEDVEAEKSEEGCVITDEPVVDEPVNDEPVDDVVDDEPVDTEPETFFTVNYVLRDFSSSQAAKMDEAIELLIEIVNSERFKQRVLNHTYNGLLTFVDNKGLTNAQIYQALMDGSETLNPAIDSEMDIDITLYYSNNSTVGYTYPNSERIWVNDKFFRTNTLGKVAANVIHEWTHKLGFDHDFNRTSRRNYSVPYGIGTIVRQLIDEKI